MSWQKRKGPARQLPIYVPVRLILLLVVLLLTIGSIAASFDAPPTAREMNTPQPTEFEWVRTAEGWQRPVSWGSFEETPPPMHPGVVASLIALTSLWALIAYPPTSPTKMVELR